MKKLEYKLIIDLLEKYIDNEKVINIDIFNNINFSKFHYICEINGITTIIGKVLMELKVFNNQIASETKMLSARIEFSQRMKLKTLSDILTKLNYNHIKYAIVKGVCLSYKVFKDIGIRPSTDIDILIPKKDVDKVKTILKSLGYLQGYINGANELEEYKNETKIFYELNTHSLAPFRKLENNNLYEIDINFLFHKEKNIAIDTYEFLEYLKNMRIYNIEFPVLDNTIAFLHLVLHHYRESTSLYYIYNNQDFNLLKACDIYYFAKTQVIDFDKLYFIIKKYNLVDQIAFMFSNINQIFPGFYDIILFENIEPFIKDNNLDEVKWTISLKERLQNDNRFKIIKNTLSYQQRKSLENNLKFVL